MSDTHVQATTASPSVVRPQLSIENGRVTQAYVPAFASPIEEGSLADIPFFNARHAPDDVVLSRKERDGSWRGRQLRRVRLRGALRRQGADRYGLKTGGPARTHAPDTVTSGRCWTSPPGLRG